MRALIQRVTRAKVTLPDENGRTAGAIERGFLVLLGVGQNDSEEDIRWLTRKIAGLRLFDDAEGKMNLDLAQVGGRALVVSQFTLYADCRRGNRPGFTEAAEPEAAKKTYALFAAELKARGVEVETGVFQANMAVELVNDGPVTIWLDSACRNKP